MALFRSSSGVLSKSVMQRAADWHVILEAEDVTDHEREACAAWRQQHPDHERAFKKVSIVFEKFESLQGDSPEIANAALNNILDDSSKKTSQRVGATVFTIGLALLLGQQMEWISVNRWIADHASPKGQITAVTLEDGSEIILNSGSTIQLYFNQDVRRVELTQGSVWVDVAKDSKRPFIIETLHSSATALGTQFAVELKPDYSNIIVNESSVLVCPNTMPQYYDVQHAEYCEQANQGFQTSATTNFVSNPKPIESLIATAWTQGKLVVSDWPLSQVLDALSEYRSGWIRYQADDIQHINVSGVYSLTDTDQALDVLSQHLPVNISRYTPFLTVVSMK